nr:hypothetical protein CFP56_11892 [Quercus suber]
MLTIAAETVRYCVRIYEWSGLYVPVVHARHARELVQEPGPYILGMTTECRSLFTAPGDALLVDLDRNFVLTSSPPNAWSAKQRTKLINRLTDALNTEVAPSGVPQHLRSAYGGGKLIPAGQIIVMRGEVESVQDPGWWNQDEVMKGKNTGVRAVFGGSQKKPLMTKVSMRHLNEIVRERNQYSRDAMEAWQDFINLKGRMDSELTKVTKRNNFLVEELESWKQQFLKFQAFAEQLTKETNELKIKIEGHKRENRRLTVLIEQQKEDSARLTVRLAGTEKQRDDALEALVLQQDIAEELERERKRNKKDLSALQHTNTTLLRQRDEAQRVVLHLRALIDGQAHHMEHIVKSLKDTPETAVFADAEEDVTGSPVEVSRAEREEAEVGGARSVGGVASGPSSRSSTRQSLRMDDRHLRDKTDAIAYIIRNISEQCAAAVEGLDLARRADSVSTENDEDGSESGKRRKKSKGRASQLAARSHDGDSVDQQSNASESEFGDGHSEVSGYLHPNRASQVPSTPDLVHDRSSTSMSVGSESTTATPQRHSLQSHYKNHAADIPEVPMRIVDENEEYADVAEEPVTKFSTNGLAPRRSSRPLQSGATR